MFGRGSAAARSRHRRASSEGASAPSPHTRQSTRRAGLGWLHAAAFAGLCVFGCGDDPESVGELGSVYGTVRDEATKARLKGAKVVFISDTLETFEGRTNGEGEYDLPVFTRSVHGRIQASKSGFQTKSVSVFLDDTTVQIDVDLPRANPPR